MNNYRHGDLAIKQITKLPDCLTKAKDTVLAYGESTGHKHLLIADNPQMIRVLEDKNGNKYLEVKGGAKLTHEEHKTIEIERGFYIVEHEKEFDYFDNEINQVRD